MVSPRRRSLPDRQDRAIPKRPETFAFDRCEHVADRGRVRRTLVPFRRPVFRANAGQHFGQTPGGRRSAVGGRRRIPACTMMIANRRDTSIDRGRIQPGGRLIACEYGDYLKASRQLRQAMSRTPGGKDRPIGVIRPPRRARSRSFSIGRRAFDLSSRIAGSRSGLLDVSRPMRAGSSVLTY
jgi:hypothetical protein